MSGKDKRRPLLDEVLGRVNEEESKQTRRGAPLTRARVDRVVRAFVCGIVERALRGERVFVPGLGVFKAVTRKPRRTLHEGRWYTVPARRVVVMRPVRAVKRGVE